MASPSLTYEGAAAPIKVSLLPNPSHLGKLQPLSPPYPHIPISPLRNDRPLTAPALALALTEAVNPVAMGKARAKQFALLKNSPEDCTLGDRVMCVQLHGDGSFTGQGVVMEGLGLSKRHLSFEASK